MSPRRPKRTILVTTLLARHAQVHQAFLAQHVSPFDPEAVQRLKELEAMLAPQLGSQAAPAAAQAALYSIVVRQAMLLAFVDNVRLMALLALACVPMVLLLRPRGGRRANPSRRIRRAPPSRRRLCIRGSSRTDRTRRW
jgi:MFS transporter, DHA2 family, multidrug resistance protein